MKRVIVPFLLIDNQSIAGGITSPSTNLQYLEGIVYQFDFYDVTGSGYIRLEGRVSQPAQNKNYESQWVSLAELNPDIVINSSTNSIILDITQTQIIEVRVRIVDVSSLTGTLFLTLSGKAFGS